jgi:hypothetical protein
MSAFTTRWNWRFLRRDASLAEAIDHLNTQMHELDHLLNSYASDLEFGPVPGAYLSVQLSYTESGGLTVGVKDLVPISFDAVPRAVYAYTDGAAGTLTIDINNGGSDSILAAPLFVNGSVTLNSQSDFAVKTVSVPDLNLVIDSIDSGTPVHLRVLVILQHVTKVEDQ